MNTVITRQSINGQNIEIGFDAESFDWIACANGKTIDFSNQTICSIDKAIDFCTWDKLRNLFLSAKENGATHIMGGKLALFEGEAEKLEHAREHARNQAQKEKQMRIEEGLKNGSHVKVLLDAPKWNEVKIGVARFPNENEKSNLSECFLTNGVFMVECKKLVHIKAQELEKFIGDRPSTHTANGCLNYIWIISDEEERKLLTEEEKRSHNINAKTNETLCSKFADMTEQQIKAAEKEYDLVYNEGGEGYNPYRN